MIIRMADYRPLELQDVLPSDTRIKAIVFAGDTRQAAQRERLQALADGLEKSEGFLKRFTPTGAALDTVFDIIVIWRVILE